MKDNFSADSAGYARFRPRYPPELTGFLKELAPAPDRLWDCATGNGQLALAMAPFFTEVLATDISENQLLQAPARPNIRYLCRPAEDSGIDAGSIDLVTVAQAVHWFDPEAFYAEVRRVTVAGGVLALIGYGLIRISPELDKLIDYLYTHITGPFWDPERRHIDRAYQSLPFPFPALPVPELYIPFRRTCDEILGYLRTWSAAQHFKREKGYDPTDEIEEAFRAAWGNVPYRDARFPLFIRAGIVHGKG